MNNNNELIAFSKIEIQILSNIKVPTKIRPKCVDTCTTVIGLIKLMKENN